MEILLVTSRSGKRWVIPKGLVEGWLTPAESAAKEALEEAGIRGELSAQPVGGYFYAKWGGICEVDVYLMRVEEILPRWPEDRSRRRQWLAPARAAERVKHADLARLLLMAPQLCLGASWTSESLIPTFG